MALDSRTIAPSLMHHSDRGLQFACDEYVKVLHEHALAISMSRPGNPCHNAMAESFMTIKVEEVYSNECTDFADALTNIEHFIETVYNQKRLHSSLEYCTPDEIETEYHRLHSTFPSPKRVSIQGQTPRYDQLRNSTHNQSLLLKLNAKTS